MGVATASVRIGRPVEDVRDVLTHVENAPKWNRNALEVDSLRPGPMRVGSRRRATVKTFAGRPHTNLAEMVEFVPNRRMVVKSVDGRFTWRAVIEFDAVPEGTTLDGPGRSSDQRACSACSARCCRGLCVASSSATLTTSSG
jgi:uncharacterized membrane protein